MKSTSYQSPNITFNTDDLIFTIAFRDKDFNVINDPSILYIDGYYEVTATINGNYETYLNQLDFMNCSNISNFFNKRNLGDIFISTGLIEYTCFSWKGGDIVLGGHFGTEFYGNINIDIKKCVNNTEAGIICKSQEYIDSVAQDGWLEITYITAYADFNNYSTPIQYSTEDFYTQTDAKLSKRVYLYFNPLYFYSENNIIFTNQKVDKAIKFDRYTTDINRVTEDSPDLYIINLISSTNKEEYYRKYDKIQDYTSTIGGLWYGLGLVAYVMACHYKEKELNCFIANSLFTFVPLEEDTKQNFSIFTYINHKKISKISQNKICNESGNNTYLQMKNKRKKNENLNVSGNQLKNNEVSSNINNRLRIGNISNNLVASPENMNPKIVHNKSQKIINKSMIITQQKNNIITSSEQIKKINYHFGKLTYTLFCRCTETGKHLNNEYEKVVKALQKYNDFIKLSFNLFDLEKIKEIIIEKGISENWEPKSKIVFVNQLSTKGLFRKDKSKLSNENILNDDMIISKNRNKDNKIKTSSLYIKMKDNENINKRNVHDKDNNCIQFNLVNENENSFKNDKNKIKDNNSRDNSAISSLHRELKSSSVFNQFDLK